MRVTHGAAGRGLRLRRRRSSGASTSRVRGSSIGSRGTTRCSGSRSCGSCRSRRRLCLSLRVSLRLLLGLHLLHHRQVQALLLLLQGQGSGRSAVAACAASGCTCCCRCLGSRSMRLQQRKVCLNGSCARHSSSCACGSRGCPASSSRSCSRGGSRLSLRLSLRVHHLRVLHVRGLDGARHGVLLAVQLGLLRLVRSQLRGHERRLLRQLQPLARLRCRLRVQASRISLLSRRQATSLRSHLFRERARTNTAVHCWRRQTIQYCPANALLIAGKRKREAVAQLDGRGHHMSHVRADCRQTAVGRPTAL